MNERTHFVYEAYDADGLLLYVGCTGRPTQRYRSHMAGDADARGWFNPFVTDWKVYGPYTKAKAYAIEKERIVRLQPIFNGHSVGNFGNAKRQLIQAYLDHHGVHFEGDWRGKPVLVKNRHRHLSAVSA